MSDKDWIVTGFDDPSLITIKAREYYTPYVNDHLVSGWCRENGIVARRYKGGMGLDVWTVRDEKDRALFALRWGTGPMEESER